MVSFEKKEQYALLAFLWCQENFGICKRKKKKLEFIFTHKNGYYQYNKRIPIFGCYCNYRNRITIYEPKCKKLSEVVSTVIHEYTHYLQSSYQYEIYEKKYPYSKNPYEIEAVKNERKYTKICMKYIKNTIQL